MIHKGRTATEPEDHRPDENRINVKTTNVLKNFTPEIKKELGELECINIDRTQ